MARPRTFDESAVLDAVAAQFRVYGFSETSTEQLCAAAGVRRSSLYNAFVSKEELFLRALTRMIGIVREQQVTILGDVDRSGGDRIRLLLDAVLEEERSARAGGHAAGCMVVQSFMDPDLRSRDERVARVLERDLEERLGLLAGALAAGVVDGSVRPEVNPARGARLIVALISGIRVTAQSGVGLAELREIVADGLSPLLS